MTYAELLEGSVIKIEGFEQILKAMGVSIGVSEVNLNLHRSMSIAEILKSFNVCRRVRSMTR